MAELLVFSIFISYVYVLRFVKTRQGCPALDETGIKVLLPQYRNFPLDACLVLIEISNQAAE